MGQVYQIMASRKIEDLLPETQIKYHKFASLMSEANIPFLVTCTYRNQEEQDELYRQGRTKTGKIVTWVKHSKHTDKRAFDIAIMKDNKPTWDLKVSTNKNDIPDYREAASLGRQAGLKAGADFGDYPHFQDDEKYFELEAT